MEPNDACAALVEGCLCASLRLCRDPCSIGDELSERNLGPLLFALQIWFLFLMAGSSQTREHCGRGIRCGSPPDPQRLLKRIRTRYPLGPPQPISSDKQINARCAFRIFFRWGVYRRRKCFRLQLPARRTLGCMWRRTTSCAPTWAPTCGRFGHT